MKDGIYLNDIPIDLFLDYFNETEKDNEIFTKHQSLVRNTIEKTFNFYNSYPYILTNGEEDILVESDNKETNITNLPIYNGFLNEDLKLKITQKVKINSDGKSNLCLVHLYEKTLFYNNLIDCGKIDMYKGTTVKVVIGDNAETKSLIYNNFENKTLSINISNYKNIYELIDENISVELNGVEVINSKIIKTENFIEIEGFKETKFSMFSGKIQLVLPITLKKVDSNEYLICTLKEVLKKAYRNVQIGLIYGKDTLFKPNNPFNTVKNNQIIINNPNIVLPKDYYAEDVYYKPTGVGISFTITDNNGNKTTYENTYLYLNDLYNFFKENNRYYETWSQKIRGRLVPDNIVYNKRINALSDSLVDILNGKQISKYDSLLSEEGFYKVYNFTNGFSEFIRKNNCTDEKISLTERSLISIDNIDYCIIAENDINDVQCSLIKTEKENNSTTTIDTRGLITRLKEYEKYPLNINYIDYMNKKNNEENIIVDNIYDPLIFVDDEIKPVIINYELYNKIFQSIKEKSIKTFASYLKNTKTMTPNEYYKFQDKESMFISKLTNIENNLKEIADADAKEKAVIADVNEAINKLFSTWRPL